MALASFRRDDPGPYPTSPLFATEPEMFILFRITVTHGNPRIG
jgi:hypothetical protein